MRVMDLSVFDRAAVVPVDARAVDLVVPRVVGTPRLPRPLIVVPLEKPRPRLNPRPTPLAAYRP